MFIIFINNGYFHRTIFFFQIYKSRTDLYSKLTVHFYYTNYYLLDRQNRSELLWKK